MHNDSTMHDNAQGMSKLTREQKVAMQKAAYSHDQLAAMAVEYIEQIGLLEKLRLETADKLREAETARDQQGRYAVEMFDECRNRQNRINELEQANAQLREAATKALDCIEIQNMHSWDEQPTVEAAIANGFWCKMAIDARALLLKALGREA